MHLLTRGKPQAFSHDIIIKIKSTVSIQFKKIVINKH